MPPLLERAVRRFCYDDLACLRLFRRLSRMRTIVSHAMKIPDADRDQQSRY